MPSDTPSKGWFKRLKEGLHKTSSSLTSGITQIFTHKKLDEEMLGALEDLLISADVGLNVTQTLIDKLRKERLHQEISEKEVREILAKNITELLEPYVRSLPEIKNHTPFIILVVGVNGSGKTTTIAKLAHYWQEKGTQALLVAGDTFRAAAVEQLKIWGDRLKLPVLSKETGSDAAALCFEAVEQAKQLKEQLVILDTAGRLHTNTNLMDELEKIRRVIKKIDATAPHLTLLVVDATLGQNAYQQVAAFQEKVHVDGLILTKLDGTAKGGVVIGLSEKFKLPLYAIGCGEQINDLRPFEAHDFSSLLMGVQEENV
ncbi:MAG: signal recognition particle-docking protein FtsY [Proteobacteria bacterium]|nr:signal recognition particle-docking protein FtsY [Pseudomonadota bacterium]